MLALLQLGIDSISFVLSFDIYSEFVLAALLLVVIIYVIKFIKGWCSSI